MAVWGIPSWVILPVLGFVAIAPTVFYFECYHGEVRPAWMFFLSCVTWSFCFPWKSLLWRLVTLLDCALVLTALWLFSGSAVKIQIFFLRCFINLYFEISIAFHLFWLLLWGFQFCICWISIACLTRDNSIYKCLKSKSVFRYKADLSLSSRPTSPKWNVCSSNYIFSFSLLVSIFYLYCTRNPLLLWWLLFSC